MWLSDKETEDQILHVKFEGVYWQLYELLCLVREGEVRWSGMSGGLRHTAFPPPDPTLTTKWNTNWIKSSQSSSILQ
jgi:hypothetical protein